MREKTNMGQIGLWQLVLILALLVLVFGSKRLPDTARSLGKSMRILKSETAALRDDGRQAGSGGGQDGTARQTAPRPIQAAPEDAATSRPDGQPRGAPAQG